MSDSANASSHPRAEWLRWYADTEGAPTGNLRAAADEIDRLREALEAYHALAPRIAEYLNDIGAMLSYSDLHRANQLAEKALRAEA